MVSKEVCITLYTHHHSNRTNNFSIISATRISHYTYVRCTTELESLITQMLDATQELESLVAQMLNATQELESLVTHMLHGTQELESLIAQMLDTTKNLNLSLPTC
jgi:methyl-accepting chemotaxis protein